MRLVRALFAMPFFGLLTILVSTASAASVSSLPEPKDVLLMASTIGPIDAGIVGALEEAYFADSGVRVRHAGAGTGAALEMAKRGGFDLVMVHARSLEEQFVAEGYGVDRRDIMYNDFVLLGPAEDPASIRGRGTIAALKHIADTQAPFVTRGDNSGTHVKEKELWAKAEITPQGGWYKVYARGADGNAPTLRYADAERAYILMDRATCVTLKTDLRGVVLVEGDPDLLNYIAVIRMDPARFPRVSTQTTIAFVDWLVSDRAQQLIQSFGRDRYGESLFFPNSDEWRRTHAK